MADAVTAAPAPKPAAAPKKKKAKIVAVVNQEGCTGCDACIEFCPVDCIFHIPGPENIVQVNPHAQVNGVVVVDEDVCIGCKLCAKYCPWETIVMLNDDTGELLSYDKV